MTELECRYCRAVNDAEERRCVRCGRRLHLAAPRPAPDSYALASVSLTATAAAPVLERYLADAPRPAEPRERWPYQASLFREGPGASKVIPIPTLTPLRPRESSSVHRALPRTAPQRRRVPDSQQALDLQAGTGVLAPQTEAIYCDAPIAPVVLRAMSALTDLSMVLIGLGLFLGVFYLCGGDLALNRGTVPFLAGVAVVIAMFYRSLFCLANGDTPGMRFARLRLVDFDGHRPGREQRCMRQIAGILSILSVGLGLVWALVDEESLTWHDHISKTFPTPIV